MGSKVPSGSTGSEKTSPGATGGVRPLSKGNPCTISQWVERVINYSSQYDASSWCADCVIGPPKVFPRYGDTPGAWASRDINANQFLELRYKEAVYIEEIKIFETYNAGGVRRVLARTDSRGEWQLLYKADQLKCIKSSRQFSPPIANLSMKCSELRLEIDCSAANTWVEIDAVELIGVTTHLPPPPSLEELSDDLGVLVNNKTFSDIKFLVSDRKVYAHRAILMARSEYFRAMFCNNMKETREKDSITLKDVPFDGFFAVMHFIYTNKIPDFYKVDQMLDIWRVADRFSMEGLKTMSAYSVCNGLNSDNVVKIYCDSTSTLPVIEEVRDSCVDFMRGRMPVVVKSKPFEDLPKDIMLEIIQLTNKMKIT